MYPVEDDELKRSFKDTKDDVLLVGSYQASLSLSLTLTLNLYRNNPHPQ